MKSFIRALAVVAFAALGIGLADAQTTTNFGNNANKVPPRAGIDPQVHFIRTLFTFQSCVLSSGSCVVKFTNAALPYNAIVLRVTAVVYTAFNSGTSDALSVGTTSANANEIVASSTSLIHAAGFGAATVASTSPGAIGGGATQTGDDGGFNLFAKWTSVGTAPTAGVADIVIEYIPGTDGVCTSVPLGSTAAAC